MLFINHLSVLLVLLSCPPIKLSFCRVSALGSIYYWYFCQFFLHWRLKILIWWNYQLIFVSVLSRKKYLQKQKLVIYIILQIIYVCIITMVSCCILSSFDIFTFHISLTTNYDQWFFMYLSEQYNCTQYLIYFIFLLFLSSVHWRKTSKSLSVTLYNST